MQSKPVRLLPVKLNLKSSGTVCVEIEPRAGVCVLVSLNSSTVCVSYREDQPVNPKAKWNGKAL